MDNVSIIIPCFNTQSWVDRCIESVLKQNYEGNVQIVLVNDGSTDGTLDHLKMWESRYEDKIILVNLEHNCGLGSARNVGLNYADGEWIMFLDADDWIEPDALNILIGTGEKNNCDFVTSLMERDFSESLTYFEDRNDGPGKMWVLDNFVDRRLFFHLKEASYSACARVVKRDFLLDNRILFPEGITYEDTYWGALCNYYAKRVCIMDIKLYHYFYNPHSIVLRTESVHHMDCLTDVLMLRDEFVRRGIYEEYKEEIDAEFLSSCYYAMMKIAIFRYEVPSYSVYRLARLETLRIIPDYENNLYFRLEQPSEAHALLIDALKNEYSKYEFALLAEKIRREFRDGI